MRAHPRRPALEVAREPGIELVHPETTLVVGDRGGFEPESVGVCGESRGEKRDDFGTSAVELGAELGELPTPRLHRIQGRDPCSHTAESGVPLPEYGGVLAGKGRARWKDAAEHAVQVRAANERAALDDSEAVGGEDERCETHAHGIRARDRRSVDTDSLPLALHERHLRVHGRRGVLPSKGHARSIGAETDEASLRTRTRREPLTPEVERLEQVRLPDAVRPGDENEPGRKVELELGVGAEVAERDSADDQPASLIGMIR
jgi:hypothetical protein